MPTPPEQFVAALQRHAPDFGVELADEHIGKLQDYYSLLLKWNARLHLVAPCSPEEFATRHVLESLILLKHLPANTTVADIGSGAGLPIIPCLIARDHLQAALIEASQKKAVFLREALRLVDGADRASVLNRRFEEMATPEVNFVTCRALDQFTELLPAIIEWAPPDATFLFFVGDTLRRRVEAILSAIQLERIPLSDGRFVVIGRR